MVGEWKFLSDAIFVLVLQQQPVSQAEASLRATLHSPDNHSKDLQSVLPPLYTAVSFAVSLCLGHKSTLK